MKTADLPDLTFSAMSSLGDTVKLPIVFNVPRPITDETPLTGYDPIVQKGYEAMMPEVLARVRDVTAGALKRNSAWSLTGVDIGCPDYSGRFLSNNTAFYATITFIKRER